MTLPDLEKYRPFTKDFDMTDEQKDELIRTTWAILWQLVDRAFDTPSLQSLRSLNDN